MAVSSILTIEQGATFQKLFTWQDSNGDPIDLTNYTSASMEIRDTDFDGEILMTLSTDNSRITLGGALGTISLEISASDTASLDFTVGVYDIELTRNDGYVKRLVQGSVEMLENATRGA